MAQYASQSPRCALGLYGVVKYLEYYYIFLFLVQCLIHQEINDVVMGCGFFVFFKVFLYDWEQQSDLFL